MECMTCDNGRMKLRFSLSKHKIVECESCGVLFNETFYDSEEFRMNLFEGEYYDEVQSQAFQNRLEKFENDPSVKVYRRYLEIVERNIGRGRVLDVGCAFGTFLKVATDRGWEPAGVEISKYSSEACRKLWGFNVFTGDLNDAPLAEESFDLITFWDVIEHVRDPRRNLIKARRLLKSGGYLLITTDNFFSLLSILASIAYKASFGYFTFPVDRFYIPHNTCYFTPDTMSRLVSEVGFKSVFFEKKRLSPRKNESLRA